MKVEELIGSKVWIKTDQFRSVPGKITSTSHAINLDDIKSSVCQSTFRVEMLSGDVIEILGSNISKIENPRHPAETSVLAEMDSCLVDVCGSHQNACLSLPPDAHPMKIRSLQS